MVTLRGSKIELHGKKYMYCTKMRYLIEQDYNKICLWLNIYAALLRGVRQMAKRPKGTRVVILGAAGRDFHDFNVVFRGNPRFEVVAFTQAMGQNMAWKKDDIGPDGFKDRRYPPSLAGRRYPGGIPIWPEDLLEEVIERYDAEMAVLSYSDLPPEKVRDLEVRCNTSGVDFMLLAPGHTMIRSNKPVIAVVASRTGAGKSTISRAVVRALKRHGKKVVAVRHPMPYGDLAKQRVQRFRTHRDLKRHECTLEEREEYEPHIDAGNVVYAGVDYEAILKRAEKEADIILWDGGNNDTAFYRPDLQFCVVGPFRPGDEVTYHPGTVSVRTADVVIINKVETAPRKNIQIIEENVRRINRRAKIIHCKSPVIADRPELIKGKTVLVLEDGPTVTHGQQPWAAGYVAAKKYKARRIFNPRPYVIGNLKRTFDHFKQIGPVLPTMGYGAGQMKEIESVLKRIGNRVDAIVMGTPIDLTRVMEIEQPIVRIRYEAQEVKGKRIAYYVDQLLKRTL
jgi:predicted GTPase